MEGVDDVGDHMSFIRDDGTREDQVTGSKSRSCSVVIILSRQSSRGNLDNLFAWSQHKIPANPSPKILRMVNDIPTPANYLMKCVLCFNLVKPLDF